MGISAVASSGVDKASASSLSATDKIGGAVTAAADKVDPNTFDGVIDFDAISDFDNLVCSLDNIAGAGSSIVDKISAT